MNENNLENEIKDVVDEVPAEEVAQVAEETCECCKDAAEEVAEATEETCECCKDAAEEVAEAAEETCECCKEAAEEVAEAAPIEATDKNPSMEKPVVKGAPKKTPVIKQKSKVNPTTLIVALICAVVVIACVVFAVVMIKQKNAPKKVDFKLAAHDTINVTEPNITDETIDSYASAFQSSFSTTEEVTTGTVEDGDTVHIQYVGTIDGVAFDGGSTGEAGTDLTIGSGSYIDGFESGLIGKKVGETVTLDLQFPESYGNADLAGKACQFEVTIDSKKITHTPEFTDEFVKENSYEYTGMNFGEAVQLDTVADFRDYVKQRVYDAAIDQNLTQAIYDLVDMDATAVPEYEVIRTATLNQLSQYASMYGFDANTLATYYGAPDAATYCTNEADYEVKLATAYSEIAKELGITHTDAEVDEAVQKFIDDNGYTDQYTLESFKETSGPGWLYMFKNYEMNAEAVNAAMKDRMVLVPEE